MLLQLTIKAEDGNHSIKGKVTYQHYTNLNYYYWDDSNLLEKSFMWDVDRKAAKMTAEIMNQTNRKADKNSK